ncbi:fumarylacetoacetate hydrolase family protein [Virgibacillus xinjiangensis]|uniref:Fumarylacetoacetate hydrolase family protein n=1 Tax=Virgibacillus xinjiangensis TaxID=393090 RepID=A0ABV7CZ54_9BACI
MKFFTYFEGKDLKPGVKTAGGLLDISDMVKDINELIQLYNDEDKWAGFQHRLEEKESGKDDYLNETSIQFGPCEDKPGKIICVGLNYQRHADESGMEAPEVPVLFNKYNNTLAGSGEAITIPEHAKKIDYEAELALVIGKQAKNVDKDAAGDYIFGYSSANDLSARDLQFQTNQWLLGKNLDGFCPLGPYLVTKDEVPNANALSISCKVNGEVRQQSNTSDMIFDCEDIVSFISHHMTLEPGDVILTGTPEGVILGYEEDKRNWLRAGDEVMVEIEGLGKLQNVLQ